MPYIHVSLATGRPRNQKRSLIRGLTDATERVLEVARRDIFVFLWELPTDNLGEAGEEPLAAATNNVVVMLRKGRPPEVRHVLIDALTTAVEDQLDVPRKDIHLVLAEVPPDNVGEAGIPMAPPTLPSWYATRLA
jgi:4-oxalocrotonate tautomerase family enzyme